MSDTGDNAPLVPRRTLGRAPQSAETTQPSLPAYGAHADQQTQPARGLPSHAASTVDSAHQMSTAPPLQPAPPQRPSSAGPAAPAPPQQTTVTKPPKAPKASRRSKAPKSPKPPKRSKASKRGPRTIRRAKLHLVRVDPWSVTKVSFLLSIAFGIMCVVAVFLIFSIMNASGLWDAVNETANELYRPQPDEAPFDVTDYVGMERVMGLTMLIAAVDVVLITALATLGAFIYNMGAALLGGVEVTLAEDIQ